MSVAARFFVQSTTTHEGATANHVQLGAVCRGAANSAWSSATPCGQISMHIRNDAAFEQFAQGEEYEVTFRKVEKPVEGDGHSVSAYDNHGSWTCGVCGFYAKGQTYGVVVDDPATLDWSEHDKHFAKQERT